MMSAIPQRFLTAASGITAGLRLPCQNSQLNEVVLNELFQNSLPMYIQQMRNEWGNIHCTQVSGLVHSGNGNPFDDCVRDGAWSPEIQAAHGGPIPFLTCSRGSRGAVASWPYAQGAASTRWEATGHSRYVKSVSQQPGQNEARWKEVHETDCRDLDWTVGRSKVDGSRKKTFHQIQAESGKRIGPWRPHKGRAGQKRSRCTKPKPDDRVGKLVVFFANITNLSENAKHKAISRGTVFCSWRKRTATQSNTTPW